MRGVTSIYSWMMALSRVALNGIIRLFSGKTSGEQL